MDHFFRMTPKRSEGALQLRGLGNASSSSGVGSAHSDFEGGMLRLLKLMTWLIVGFIIGGLSVSAFASTPQWSAWTPQEPSAHCSQQFVASGAGNNGWVHHSISYTNTPTGQQASCIAQCTDAQKCGSQLGTLGGYGTPATRSATCSPPEMYYDGECIADCQSKSGQQFDGAVTLNTLQQNYCWNGCRAQLVAGVKGGSICNGGYGSTGVGLWWPCDSGTFRYTGQTCAQADPALPTQQPNQAKQCPSGTCPGTVNGLTICAACGSTTPRQDITSTTKTNADNSTTTTTTTTTTTSTGTSTTSTTTNTAPDGTPTGTSTTTDVKPSDAKNDMEDFCALNPTLSICKESNFGGACGSFSCDGDAIQCAMAREQHQRNCSLYDEANSFSSLVDHQNPAGTASQIAEGEAALNKDKSKDLDLWATFQQKQQTYMQFSSDCPAAMGFDFKGQHYDFDLSVLCEIGKVLKLLLHLSAYMIVMGLLARSIPV